MTDIERLAAQAAALGYALVPATEWQATQDLVESAASAAPYVSMERPSNDLWRDLSRLTHHDAPKLGRLSRLEEAQHQRILLAIQGAARPS